jgi:Alcohol dehydrogenase transcription factor Myb/SANT-like
MREFSIQKDLNIENSNNLSLSTNLSPDHLIYEEYKDSTGETAFFDYTDQFLERIKEFPVLYDQHAEMRKYRSKEAWKQISDQMSGKFSVGKLRNYWILLIKKYKIYLENSHGSCQPIENEALFESLSFTNIGIQIKREPNLNNEIRFILPSDEMDSSREFFEDLNEEEHLLCEEVDDGHDISVRDESTSQTIVPDDETVQAIESIEEIKEPETKRQKIELKISESFPPTQAIAELPPPFHQNSHAAPTAEDEFDYFGKKVALQLRHLSHKNRSLARKGEIQVLQLLMELEESLES